MTPVFFASAFRPASIAAQKGFPRVFSTAATLTGFDVGDPDGEVLPEEHPTSATTDDAVTAATSMREYFIVIAFRYCVVRPALPGPLPATDRV